MRQRADKAPRARACNRAEGVAWEAMSKALSLVSPTKKNNHLLAALPEATYLGLLPFLEWVPLPARAGCV